MHHHRFPSAVVLAVSCVAVSCFVALPASASPRVAPPSETGDDAASVTDGAAETRTTGADPGEPSPPPEDPQAAAREKLEREAARRKAEAERRSGWQVAPIFGWGHHSTTLHRSLVVPGSTQVSAYGVGAGLRAGYVLTRGMYVGAAFVYHFGGSTEVPGGRAEGRIAYGGVELGHQIPLGYVIARPYAGVGYASVTLRAPVEGAMLDASGGKPALWAGVTGLVPLGASESFFVGLDARYTGIFGVEHFASANGITFSATGGAKF